jgi:hypothetical protein
MVRRRAANCSFMCRGAQTSNNERTSPHEHLRMDASDARAASSMARSASACCWNSASCSCSHLRKASNWRSVSGASDGLSWLAFRKARALLVGRAGKRHHGPGVLLPLPRPLPRRPELPAVPGEDREDLPGPGRTFQLLGRDRIIGPFVRDQPSMTEDLAVDRVAHGAARRAVVAAPRRRRQRVLAKAELMQLRFRGQAERHLQDHRLPRRVQHLMSGSRGRDAVGVMRLGRGDERPRGLGRAQVGPNEVEIRGLRRIDVAPRPLRREPPALLPADVVRSYPYDSDRHQEDDADHQCRRGDPPATIAAAANQDHRRLPGRRQWVMTPDSTPRSLPAARFRERSDGGGQAPSPAPF